jgi:glyoxylase-like metal-dependent hydrolase (beta-lactamase superfamily II)
MCTHFHWDHVGWNTRLAGGEWVPTFPNARHIMARREYEYWDAAHARGDESMHAFAFADSVLPIRRAQQALLVEQDFALEDGIWLAPASGHTPGNVVINIESKGQRGVFSGDVLHSPMQLLRPDWSTRACWDPAMARQCRHDFIEQHADTGHLIMPAHFSGPSAGRIEHAGAAFRFVS